MQSILCARFSHNPKHGHSTTVKHILRYLKGTVGKGMIIKPNHVDTLGCYVNSDFAGNYNTFLDQDPTSPESRSGYVILFQGCPILRVSKMQTQCALSTMESQYLALSQAMGDLIPLQEMIKEVNKEVPNKDIHIPKCSSYPSIQKIISF